MTEKPLTYMDIVKRTCMIVKALLLDYEFKCSNGMVIKLDSENNVWMKGQRRIQVGFLPIDPETETAAYETCWLKAGFELDIKYLFKEVQKISEAECMKISAYIAMNENKFKE